MGKASVCYAEPGEDDFKVTGRLVGGAPGTRGIERSLNVVCQISLILALIFLCERDECQQNR